VTALSPTKVYAVGQGDSRALVAKWDGSIWTLEAVPAPEPYSNLLGTAVTGTSTVWAAGIQMDSGGILRTLAMRTSNG
jgi:hypothetical protein